MPFQKLYNSKHLQVFSANNEVLTRTAGRPTQSIYRARLFSAQNRLTC